MKKSKIHFNRSYVYYFLFISVVIALAFLGLWRALDFHFWRDDWADLWALSFHPETGVYFNNGNALKLHPGAAVERVIGAKFFGLNTFSWQIYGIFLRIFDSLAVALMVLGLTKSKKAGILAGLFMAPLLGGLESVTWNAAHSSALIIFFFAVGTFFWVTSLDMIGRYSQKFILAIIFLSLAFSISPARGVFIILALASWDFLTWFRVKNKQTFLKILLRNGILVLMFILLIDQLNSRLGMVSYGDLPKTLGPLLSNPDLIENYLASLGNLLVSWLYPINEPVSLGVPTTTNLISSFSFIFLVLVMISLFLFKKSRWLQVVIFFSFWLFLFYIPSWLFEKTLVVGSSHRYVSISAVALPCLAAIFIYKLKSRFLVLFSLIFIILNVIAANRVLKGLSEYRSYKIVQPIWDQIVKEVTPNQKDTIFMYYGSDLVWGTSMAWSGSVPFGIMRGIRNPDDLPITTGDRQLIIKLLCETGVSRPSVANWSIQNNRIPISHLYAWVWKNGVLTNISEREREAFIKEAKCKVLP